MKYKDILGDVTQRADIPERQADAAVKASLQALAEQSDPKQFADLLEQMPREIKSEVAPAPTPQYRSLPDFFNRIAELSGLGTDQARDAAEAVIAVIVDKINYDQVEDLFGRMPSQFMDLMPVRTEHRTAGRMERPTPEEFIRRVRNKANLSSDEEAMEAVRATLSVLSQRITGGQAQDLATFLPEEIRKYLAGAEPEAKALDKNEFFDRIAGIEHTDHDTAVKHAAAVLTALSDTVPRKEIQDTLDQLPPGVKHLVGAAARQR
jgi:uncharacterized protein (DUF2267 family)